MMYVGSRSLNSNTEVEGSWVGSISTKDSNCKSDVWPGAGHGIHALPKDLAVFPGVVQRRTISTLATDNGTNVSPWNWQWQRVRVFHAKKRENGKDIGGLREGDMSGVLEFKLQLSTYSIKVLAVN
jgi:hypothetical protein